MRISDWSSDVCSSDLRRASCDQILLRGYLLGEKPLLAREVRIGELKPCTCCLDLALDLCRLAALDDRDGLAAPDRLAEVARQRDHPSRDGGRDDLRPLRVRSEEHTYELK